MYMDVQRVGITWTHFLLSYSFHYIYDIAVHSLQSSIYFLTYSFRKVLLTGRLNSYGVFRVIYEVYSI